MSMFERYLSVWIAPAIVAGIAIGSVAPSLVEAIAAAEVASVNLVVAVLIWAMVYPMMIGVDPGSLMDGVKQPKGLAITLAVNRLIKPFTMAAPCTAMVFVWSLLTRGDESYSLGVLVEVPVMLSLVAFANRTRSRFA